jgi:hypothetical protein
MYLAAGAAGMLAVLLNLGPHTRSSPLHAAFLGMGLAVLVGLGFSIALAAEPAPHDGGAKTSLASYPPS